MTLETVEYHDCTECGDARHSADMIQFGHDWVCPACKDIYVQKLKEGIPTGRISIDLPDRYLYHPMGLGELLREAFVVYGTNFGSILLLFVCIRIPIIAGSHIIGKNLSGQPWLMVGVFAVAMVGVLIAEFYSTIVLKLAASDHANGTYSNTGNRFVTAFSICFKSLPTYGFTILIVIGGFLVLVIPGIYVMTLFAFVPSILALTERKGLDALKYSASLVKGHWWPIFATLLLITIMTELPEKALQMIARNFFPSNQPLIFIAQGIGHGFCKTLFPIVSCVMFLNHHGMRLKSEELEKRRIYRPVR